MDLLSIKRVVVAAMVLPSMALGIQSAFIVEAHYRQYQAIEADRNHAALLSTVAQFASLLVPREAELTMSSEYGSEIPDHDALSASRSEVDTALAAVRQALTGQAASGGNVSYEVMQFQKAADTLKKLRGRVDADGVSASEALAVFQSLSLSSLALAEAIGTSVQDTRLAAELRMLFDLLKANEAGLAIAFYGHQYLAGIPWSARAESSYLAGAFLFDGSVNRFERNAGYLPYLTISEFENSLAGKRLADLRRSVSRWNIAPSPENLRKWDEYQVARGEVWSNAIGQSVASLRSMGDTLAWTSERQFHFLAALIALFTLLIGIVVILGAKGVAVVGRLIEERERFVDELKKAATTDSLTGLLNRRGFDSAASVILSETHDDRMVSVVIFDLDRFKRVNDMHGHNAGDLVLQRIARISKARFRSQDILARHGGEEFLALLPDTDIDAAAALAEQVRLSVEAEPIVLPNGTSLYVTASFGCASAQLSKDAPSIAEFVKRADLALYAAKFSGRNRVVSDVDMDDGLPDRGVFPVASA